MKAFHHKIKLFATILLAILFFEGYSQNPPTGLLINPDDSLSLDVVLKQVINTHPSVMKASEAIQIAEAGIGLARSAKLPEIDFAAGYTRIGPIPSITIPDMGTFQMGANDNYNSAFNIRQSVFDFHKTDNNIQLQESTKEMTSVNVELIKQKLALTTTLNFYSLVYLQEALKIKDHQIATLREHLDFVTTRHSTGSATQYEVLSTQVRLSAAENQKVDLETVYKNTLTVMNSLMGQPSDVAFKVKQTIENQTTTENPEKMVNFAVNHRSEMILANLKKENAELNLSSIKVQNNPSLSAFSSGGLKNGYIPELGKLKANYSLGLTLKVPIFTASRQKYAETIAAANITIAQHDQEQAHRDISSEIYQNDANLQASRKKIAQSELQVIQAEEARKLAELSYKTGSLTNLDLLDAETLEAESKLNLLKAKTEYAVNIVKLDLSVGKLSF